MKYLKKFIKPLLVIAILAMACIIISNYFVSQATENVVFTSISNLPKTKIAIIFGAGIKDGKPSRYLKDRLDAGISLYKNRKVDKILLSGDNGRDEHDELTVMKLYCYKHGVDTTKIYIDYAGFDSYSTMYRAKHVFKVDTAILVSQKYHLARCVYLGKKLGVKSFGYSANKGIYPGYKYYAFREKLSVTKAVIDLFRNRKPKYLGETVDVNSKSNYTKE